MEPLLETKGITMKFGEFVANDKVDFVCEKGSIISLLGENGAGKTTLMKIIYGMYKPQSGEIFFEGHKVSIDSPRAAKQLGIQMVHQHFMLVNHLSVTENVVMGNEPRRLGIFLKKYAEKQVRELSELYGLYVDPTQKVADLTVGAKQRTEILKALYCGAKLLILDEPTAVLTPQETSELFKVMRRLKDDGKSVIIITHKLHETMDVADKIYILRHGKIGGCVEKKDTDPIKLTRLMVDHELAVIEKQEYNPGKTVLSIEKLEYAKTGGKLDLNEIYLTIREGEIYGIAGIEGNGQQELVETITGISKQWTGNISICNNAIKAKTVTEILKMGVSCIHSDRQDRGLLLDLDAVDNVLLGYQWTENVHKWKYILDKAACKKMAEEIFGKFRVNPMNTDNLARSFSGGNQQKIVVGREFYRKPKLAIVAYPTRGVDVGVSEIIHQSILDLRNNGSAVLLITADFDELFKLSDRIGVIYEGEIVFESAPADVTPTKLGYYMGGGKHEKI